MILKRLRYRLVSIPLPLQPSRDPTSPYHYRPLPYRPTPLHNAGKIGKIGKASLDANAESKLAFPILPSNRRHRKQFQEQQQKAGQRSAKRLKFHFGR